MLGGDAWGSLGRRRATLRRAGAAWAVAGLVAGALAASAAAGRESPEQRLFVAAPDAGICAAPGPDLFHDDFEAGDDCRWSLASPAGPPCPPPVCGDGLLRAGEACDDGNLIDETACAYGLGACTCCAADCSAELLLAGPVCGDSNVDSAAGEVCDDGNTVTELQCPYGVGCVSCNRFCTEELALPARYCGDFRVDADDGEACDDGNQITETACPYGTPTCTRCSAVCTVLNLTGGVCGDGAVAAGLEACDDGNPITETTCPYGQSACAACSADCQSALALGGGVCGDGAVDLPWENCDDGNTIACGTCSANCRTARSAAATGHLVAVAGDQIDDGETFTLASELGSFVFELDVDFSVLPGHIAVSITGSDTAGQVGTKIATAVNNFTAGLQAVCAGSALVRIANERATSLGNQPILETVASPEFEVAGLAGGLAGDCAAGVGCVSGDDCASGICNSGVCTPP